MTNSCAGELLVVDAIDACAVDDGPACVDTGPRSSLFHSGLSRRALQVCWDYGEFTFADLLNMHPSQVFRRPNVGPKTMLELRRVLRDHGFDWAPEWGMWADLERRK